jgi:aminocarboxymuconate-semialdehyde decarboxylase
MIIDIHTHYIPLDSLTTAAEIGKRYGLKIDRNERGCDVVTRDGRSILGPLRADFYDLNLRMSIMDQLGIDMQALSAASSCFFYWMAPEESLEYAQWLNGALADAVSKHPQRFVALASVPMQDSAEAAAELERAMTKLGLRGVEVGSNVNGRYDALFDPFWEASSGACWNVSQGSSFCSPTPGVFFPTPGDVWTVATSENPSRLLGIRL